MNATLLVGVRHQSGQESQFFRIDFINPLLTDGLGWDVDNRKGLPETYREVVYEDRVKAGGGTKAPDYGFYIGGHR